MILDKYLSDTYLKLVYDNYEDYYLKSLDEDNFDKVYNLLSQKGIKCLEDIILYYLETFDIDYEYIEKALENYDEEFINGLDNDLKLFEKIIIDAVNYSEEEI